MARPFARLRRPEGAPPEPDAPTEVVAPAGDATSTGAVPAGDAATAPAEPAPDTVPAADTVPGEPTPGFLERGRLRRRLRYVRRARELALRDLGGLVFDLRRFGRDRSDLVEQKLSALSTLDGEMRALEAALDERREITVLREPGLGSCPRCGALHASDAAYCSACGLPVGRRADLPTGPALAGPLGALPGTTGPDQTVSPSPPNGASETENPRAGHGRASSAAASAEHDAEGPAIREGAAEAEAGDAGRTGGRANGAAGDETATPHRVRDTGSEPVSSRSPRGERPSTTS